jgi:hypothetical protein
MKEAFEVGQGSYRAVTPAMIMMMMSTKYETPSQIQICLQQAVLKHSKLNLTLSRWRI